MTTTLPPELLRLPRRARMALAERLWLSAVEEDSLPVPAAHKRLLDERVARYRAGAERTITHEELLKRVRGHAQ